MPINWGEIAKIGVEVAGPLVGGIIGSQQQGKGIELSQANLLSARDQAIKAMLDAMMGAEPYARFAYDTGIGLQDWSMANQQAAKRWGLDTSRGIRAGATNQALDLLNQGYKGAVGFLSPYSTAGSNALSAVTKHVLGQGGQVNAPAGSFNFSMPTVSPGGTSPPGLTARPAVTLPKFRGPGGNVLSSMVSGGPGQFNNALTALTPGTGTRLAAGLGGIGAGAAASFGLAKLFPSLASVLGPIGLGVAAVAAPLITLFTRKGREKVSASEAAKGLGTTIENMWSAVKSGSMTMDQFKEAVQAGWNDYGTWLSGALKDSDVVAKSLASQASWINKSLQQKGVDLTVSSTEGDKWAAGGNPY